jgi:hypothetical protein
MKTMAKRFLSYARADDEAFTRRLNDDEEPGVRT